MIERGRATKGAYRGRSHVNDYFPFRVHHPIMSNQMVVANITVSLQNFAELASLIKHLGDEGLHANVKLMGSNWEVEVTKP